MSRYAYQGISFDSNGMVIPGATVNIYLSTTSTPANVYVAVAGGTAVNSVTSDSNTGRFIFFVDTNDYAVTQLFRITVSYPSYSTQVWDYINCFDVNAPLQTVTGNLQTLSYQFVLSDAGKCIYMNNGATPVTLTVPAYLTVAFAADTRIDAIQLGTGKVTIAPAAGVTINSKVGNLSISAQYVGVTLVNISTNTWVLIGDLVP